MILGLLLALIGAFLTVNQAGNNFTRNTLKSRQAQDVALAIASFAQQQLEKDPTWASDSNLLGGTETIPPGDPMYRMDLTQASGDEGVVGTGVYHPAGNFGTPVGTFEMKVRNALQKRITGIAGNVPPRCAEIVVDVNIDGTTRTLRMLLRVPGTGHESMAAGGSINMDDASGLLRIESNDPYTNRIAAKDDLNLPFADDVQFVKHGVAASGGRLNVGGTDLSTAPPETVLEAGDDSNGMYQPGLGSATLDVAEFDESELDLPTNESNVPGGEWVFGDINRYEYNPVSIGYEFEVGVPGGGKKTVSGSVKRQQKRSSLYNVLTSPSGQKWAAGTSIPGSTTEWEPPLPTSPYDSVGGAAGFGYDPGLTGGFGTTETSLPTSDVHEIAPGLKANVVTAQFAVRKGYRINTGGDFTVTGEGDRQPEMYFGYDISTGGVATQESLDDGVDAAKQDPATYMGALSAGGDIDVVGGVLGYGSMLAGGDLNIKASSGLRSAPGLGVVVKGQRIIVNPATEPEPGLPGEPTDLDIPVYRTSITTESGGDWSQYNNWLTHDLPTRTTIVDSLSTTQTGLSATSVWNTFTTEIGGGGTLPDLTSLGWSTGNLTVDQYVRLREFYQTVSTGYNDGDGDVTWLDLSIRQGDAKGRVTADLNRFAQWAESYQKSFQDYMTSPEADPPDMFMEGLIYAEEDIIINANGNSVKLKGSVIAKNGDVTINAADTIDLVYDRVLVDNIKKPLDGSNSTSLERVFFSFN